uniref:Transmembrane protein n=1 Tax=Paramoeba aestuarina TaxID=180227 RepID=A0A7S4L2S7_9EUKA
MSLLLQQQQERLVGDKQKLSSSISPNPLTKCFTSSSPIVRSGLFHSLLSKVWREKGDEVGRGEVVFLMHFFLLFSRSCTLPLRMTKRSSFSSSLFFVKRPTTRLSFPPLPTTQTEMLLPWGLTPLFVAQIDVVVFVLFSSLFSLWGYARTLRIH